MLYNSQICVNMTIALPCGNHKIIGHVFFFWSAESISLIFLIVSVKSTVGQIFSYF